MSSTLDVGLAARVIAGIRTQTARSTGCTEWDTQGVVAALRATQGPPGSVLAAAALAAEDPSLLKPTEKAFLRHWPKNASVDRPTPRADLCPDHGEPYPCRHASHDRGTADEVAAGLALCRAEVAQAAKERDPSPAAKRAQAKEAARD